jgi:hypothetical protein
LSFAHARERLRSAGLRELPKIPVASKGRNGEALAHDEAAVWKRVLNFRLAQWIKPSVILETHPGLGVSTRLYHLACKNVLASIDFRTAKLQRPCIVDIDPFGAPWNTINELLPAIRSADVVLISNGEAQAVHRNLRKAQRYPTKNFGRLMPTWVLNEYLPRVERVTRMRVAFFYAFPTTIRVIVSKRKLPRMLWAGCPHWMWWLASYAPKELGIADEQV